MPVSEGHLMFRVPQLKRVVQHEKVVIPRVYVAVVIFKWLAFSFAFNFIPELSGLSPFPYPMSGEHPTQMLWTDSYNGIVRGGHVYP